MKYLENLNSAQREAVLYIDGPSMIIAGAGSGKTRVLTHKVVHLLHKGYAPNQIMVLTFTNKAANEMRQRIENMVPPKYAKAIWMGTFHSIFARILRIEAQYIGFPSNFVIYDTIDSRNTIKQIIRELQLDPKQYQPNKIHSRISLFKNNLFTAKTYLERPDFLELDQKLKIPMFGEIFKRYELRLKKAGAMDFDDLLLYTNILFRDHPDILNYYRSIFKFILVDEYQDTNFAQYLIIKKLAEKHRKISVVGDDAQSIYAFRGARIENIFAFQKDFPEYKLFKLEQNYRSTRKIVDAANSVIAKNKAQIPKKVISMQDEGEDIYVVAHTTDYAEGQWVANEIKKLHQKENIPYSEIAILYRMNSQSRIFEDFLRKNNIPYRIYGGISFYQRKEIKDFIAYLRLSINPYDDEALRRIINYPSRGIGNKTQDIIYNLAEKQNVPIWKIISNINQIQLPALSSRSKQPLIQFYNLIRDFQKKVYEMDMYDFAKYVADKSGLLKELASDPTPEGQSRLENVQELINAIKEFAETATDSAPTIDDFLQQIALLTNEDIDPKDEKQKPDRVNVMTVHSAKGLEFHTVFLVGIEDEIFPGPRAKIDPKELEEERRLFYVAITRAKRKLYISYAKRRLFWGRLQEQNPSLFIDDIDQKLVRYNILTDDYVSESDNFQDSYSYDNFIKEEFTPSTPAKTISKPIYTPKPDLSKMKKISKKTLDQAVEEAIDYEPNTGIRVGMKVLHSRFGKGIVRAMYGKYPNTKADIDFEQFGRKKILLKFAKLQILK